VTDNPLLHNLRPTNFRQGEWVPEAWDPAGLDNQPQSRLTVALPGEFAVATVIKVVSPNACVAQLGQCLMTGKGHDYPARDHVPVRRESDGMGGERWVVVSERELMQNEMIQRFEAIERALAYPAPGSSRRAPVDGQSAEPTELADRVTASPERGARLRPQLSPKNARLYQHGRAGGLACPPGRERRSGVAAA
jgi:hypothetical protein